VVVRPNGAGGNGERVDRVLDNHAVPRRPPGRDVVKRIAKVHYDSAGSDVPVTNAKLNDEYVIVTNTDTVTHNLAGWRIRDVANHVYVFPAGATLGAKKSVRVRTGTGTDTAANRYQNRGYYIWNNDADTAWLRNPQGKGGDVCSWKASDTGSTKVC